MKENLKRHLYYSWFIYLLVGFVVVAMANFFVNQKVKIKGYEKVSIFVGTPYANETKLEKDLLNNHIDSLLEVDILHYNESDTYFGLFLQTAGSNSDILIINGSDLSYETVLSYAYCLDTIDLSFVPEGATYYEYDNKKYGIVIKDDDINYFKDYINYWPNNVYYLFINKESKNFDSIFMPNKRHHSDNATYILKKLFTL